MGLHLSLQSLPVSMGKPPVPGHDVDGDGRSMSASGGNAARPGGVLRQNGLNGRSPNKMLDSDKYSFPEESEIRRLRNKQKRKGLNTSERRKLRRLKDRLKLKVKKLKKKLDRLKKTNGSQLVTSKNFLVKKALNNVSRVNTLTNAPVKSILLPGLKMRLQKEKVESQQLNNTTVPLTQVSSESLPQEPVVVKTKQDTKHVELVVASNASVKPISDVDISFLVGDDAHGLAEQSTLPESVFESRELLACDCDNFVFGDFSDVIVLSDVNVSTWVDSEFSCIAK